MQPEAADATGIALPLVRGETLSGTVGIEGDTAKSGSPEKLTVRLNPESEPGEAKTGEVGERGIFRIDQMFPGRYRVNVMPLPENIYIKSVKAGTAETEDNRIDLSRGVTGSSIDITLSRNGGNIEGAVLDQDEKRLTATIAFVFLSATPDDVDDKNIRIVRAGAKFSYSGLRPGKYRLMAVDPGQLPGGPDNPDTLKALLAKAPEIEIHEGDHVAKDVRLTVPEGDGAKQ